VGGVDLISKQRCLINPREQRVVDLCPVYAYKPLTHISSNHFQLSVCSPIHLFNDATNLLIIRGVTTLSWCAHHRKRLLGCAQRRQSGLKSGGRGSGSTKFRFFQANIREISMFFRQFHKIFRLFQAKFRKISIFPGRL